MAKAQSHIVRRQRRHDKIRSKVNGTSVRPRLVVYKSNTSIYAQLVDDVEAKTILAISDLKVKGKTKSEKALNAGKSLAEKAKEKGLEACVFDRNGYKYIGRVKSFADGARDGGLKF